jgi:acid phosphatase
MPQFARVCRLWGSKRPQWPVSALAATVLAAVALAPAPVRAAQCPAQPFEITGGFGQSTNLGQIKRELVNYGCFGDYQRDLAREIGAAKAFIEARAGEVVKPAIVLDIDETSLSSWRQILNNDFGYIPHGPCRLGAGIACGQGAWELSAAADPIVPMVELVAAARARGVAVFFLTGRPDGAAERAATVRNLRRAGYAGWAELLMRNRSERGLGAAAYKSARRAGIAARGYSIIANIGDQDSDLAGGYAERTFKLSNPFYFIP